MTQLNLKYCEECVVYGTNNKPISTGRVISTNSSITIIFNNPNLKEANVSVIVEFHDSVKGVIRCLCKLQVRRNMQVCNANELWAADCIPMKVLENIQRHKDLRIPVTMSALCTEASSKIFRVSIENISAGGMKCKTTNVMPNGTHFQMEYTFSDVECKLDVRVLHGHREGNECVYGCEFFDILPKYEQAIRKFVLSSQKKAV